VLLLPAFSTVSTRREMWPLAEALGDGFRAVAVDWPGFGDGRQPRLDYAPDLLLRFLEAFVAVTFSDPPAVVAAGHAAGYALALARRKPGVWRKMALVAPTWRGPLPTVMGGYKPLQRHVRALVYAPLVGPLVYRLNIMMPVIGMMLRGHVYADPRSLSDERLREKQRIARRAGRRYGSASFVTGALDPVRSRQEFLTLAREAGVPVMAVVAPQIPPRSRAEIEALGHEAGVALCHVPAGALGVHEEFPQQVATCIRPFLHS
jgi:pimeloyl-ACP methyl ester carboxylesterase